MRRLPRYGYRGGGLTFPYHARLPALGEKGGGDENGVMAVDPNHVRVGDSHNCGYLAHREVGLPLDL